MQNTPFNYNYSMIYKVVAKCPAEWHPDGFQTFNNRVRINYSTDQMECFSEEMGDFGCHNIKGKAPFTDEGIVEYITKRFKEDFIYTEVSVERTQD